MVGSPRLYTVGGAGEPLWKGIEALEAQLYGHMALVLAENLLAEILFRVLADYENDFAKSSLYGVVDGVVHYGLSVWSETIKLFQTAVTASHSGS